MKTTTAFRPFPSRFVIFDPQTSRPVRHVGTAWMSNKAAERAYRVAERECGDSLAFDDTCAHGTACELCATCSA